MWSNDRVVIYPKFNVAQSLYITCECSGCRWRQHPGQPWAQTDTLVSYEQHRFKQKKNTGFSVAQYPPRPPPVAESTVVYRLGIIHIHSTSQPHPFHT